MKRELICISCPIGCHLQVTQGDGDVVVAGNECNRGQAYGWEETLAPKRIVTAVVKTGSPTIRYLPVRTDKPLPKELVMGLLKELYRLKVHLPAVAGDTLIENYRSTGVNVVLTRSAAERP